MVELYEVMIVRPLLPLRSMDHNAAETGFQDDTTLFSSSTSNDTGPNISSPPSMSFERKIVPWLLSAIRNEGTLSSHTLCQMPLDGV